MICLAQDSVQSLALSVLELIRVQTLNKNGTQPFVAEDRSLSTDSMKL